MTDQILFKPTVREGWLILKVATVRLKVGRASTLVRGLLAPRAFFGGALLQEGHMKTLACRQ
ncbi:hypothetical protein ABVV53_06210 [Novosphingobium sp. RD2P27]|uniref:Uncharacterized protein n=1 Tax=Novosphingobium kalidii TaxID=3230299 RepID=A0ABV2CZN9_9SPHN